MEKTEGITIIHPFKILVKIVKVDNITIPETMPVLDVSDIKDLIVVGAGESLFLKGDVLYLLASPSERPFILCSKGYKEFVKRNNSK